MWAWIAAGMLLLAVAVLMGQLWSVRTYRIRDGHNLLIHTTGERNPEAILAEAGIELGSGEYVLEQTEDGPMIRLLRQQHITIDYHGNLLEATSTGETVAQLLERMGLEVGEEDWLSAGGESRTFDGMYLRIARVLRQEQTYAATIPYATLCCGDPTLPVGTEQLLRQGKNGEMIRTAEVTYINGIEESRKLLSEQVIVQPVDAILAIGTGQLYKEVETSTLPMVGNGIITLPTGEVLTYNRVISSLATAYCDKGKTATGTQARVGAIAVDPEYIPYGTRMFIMSKDGEYVYGIATAEDCGSKQFIYGTRIDLHYNTRAECIQFGARMCWVYVLN